MLRGAHAPGLSACLLDVTPLPGVRAGSALLTLGDRLLVVQDDAHEVVLVGAGGDVVRRPLVGDGAALPKAVKPDYEAAVHAPDGSVWLFGSGALPGRRGAAVLAADGVSWPDLTATYDALGAWLGGAPNFEGAVLRADRLHLFHRGAADEPDAWLELAWTPDGPGTLLTARHLRVGALAGVPLHLTDATLLDDGRLVFLAAAEDTPDPVADGPVVGAAVGVLDTDGAAWTPLHDPSGAISTRKAEGIVLDQGPARQGWVVTDADDPGVAAELCRLQLSGF